MSRILISTKLKSTNIGNQALSDELIKLAELKSENKKYKIVGRPFGLDKYTFSFFNTNNPVGDFEKIAQKIAERAAAIPENKFAESDLKSIRSVLLNVEGNVVKTEKLRRIFRKIRKFYFSFFLFSRAYEDRIKTYRSIDYYLYSGAGEVTKKDLFLRQLLDLRVAQILGVKVCAINQSVELIDGIENKLLIHVYSKMHKIVVRGKLSKELLIKGGVESSLIQVCPDTAFRNKGEIIIKDKFSKKIAVNLTKHKYDTAKFEILLQKLINEGYQITYVTNDPMGDKEIAMELKEKYNISISIKSYNYWEYAKFISNFDLLISTRLHSNELALSTGVPVIPIEAGRFKTTEVLGNIDYPLNVINIERDDFVDEVLKNLSYMESNFAEMQNWVKHNIVKIADLASNNIPSELD